MNLGNAPTDPAMVAAVSWARRYAAACGEVLHAANACTAIANRAVGARTMANKRPQHEISIRNFTKVAEASEREFVPLYKAFLAVCSTARDVAVSFRSAQTAYNPEWILLTSVDNEAYDQTAVALHILLTHFGPTPSGFIDSLQLANVAIQSDIFNWGEDGFQGKIYAPSTREASNERTCPWCAETIKAAAIVCRFCGRDVSAHTT